jgi:hypothetical protein
VTRWLLLVPLAAAVVFSWVRLIAEPFDVPRDDDYVRASALLRSEGFDRARDALVILPPWSLRPLTHVADLDPLSGDAIADRPLHRWARLWALVEPDADQERNALLARRGPPSWSRAVGRVVVERWDLPPPSVSYDLAARLVDARVRVVGGDDAATECSRAPGALDPNEAWWRCGDAHRQRVRREWLHVSENADLAIYAHPPARGARLELSWDGVPVGQSVVVTAGFTRDGADPATGAKAPVRVRVLVDGELAGTVSRARAFLFATDVVDTARFAGRTATVTLAIDSEGSDDNAAAHFALDAYVVGAP